MSKENNILVIETGTFSFKYGIATYSELPPSPLRTILTEETLLNGIINHWPSLSGFINSILTKHLDVIKISNNKPVLLSLPCFWSREDLEKITQLMFEHFNVPGLYLCEQPLCTIFGYGATTGLVLDLGYSTCDVSAVVDSVVVKYASHSLELGGRDVMNYLKQLLKNDSKFKYSGPLDDEFLISLLESDCCEAFIPGCVKDTAVPVKIFHYNNQDIPIGAPRLQCFQVLFNPSLIGKNVASLPEIIYDVVINSVDSDKRLLLWENIALSGGLSGISGMKQCLEKEITSIVLSASETCNEFQAKELGFLKIPEFFSSYKDRYQNMSFVGGSIVAKSIFTGGSGGFMTKAEYNEFGPGILHFK